MQLDVVIPFLAPDSDKSWQGDVKQIVAEAFWAHHKTVSQSAYTKLVNTEMFLRYVKTKWKLV